MEIISTQTSINAFVDEYVLEIDHTSEKVSTVLSNHVSSLLAQQNHVVYLRNDMKIASTVINPRRACSNNSLRSDMALIFLRLEGSQMFRSAQFFMNIKRGRKSINHGVTYKGSSLSLSYRKSTFQLGKASLKYWFSITHDNELPL